MAQQIEERRTYTCRPFSSADTSGFLDLYETVWGREADRDWFRWRFEANPYHDEVPMIVAERDGDIVGAEPCLTFRLAVGERELLAFQPADWIVHPDHRNRGVFTQMTERLLSRYEGDGPALYFNFPSDPLVPGLRKFDWRFADGPRTHYRVQNPRRVASWIDAGSDPHSAAAERLARLATPLVRGYVGVRSRLATTASAVSVDRYDAVPAGLLTDLDERGRSGGMHVVHDAAFYRWRFDDRHWKTTTHVARRGGGAEAACVACTETVGDVRRVSVLDVRPRHGRADFDPDAFVALLRSVVADSADADLLRVGDGGFPPAVLREFGFLPNDSLPLSVLSPPRPLAVRPASRSAGGPWTLGGCDPTDGSRWSLSLADRDVT